MKPKTFTTARLVFAMIVLGITLTLVSWDFKQSTGRYQQSTKDTVPETKKITKEKKIRDLDDVLDELNSAELQVNMEKVQKELAEAMKKMDAEKIKMDVQKAMKEVYFEKIKKEVEESMSKIDMKKTQAEIETAMKEMEKSMAKVDMKKMQAEIANAMKEFDAAKIQQEVQASIAKIDWDKMKTEMDEAKKINFDKLNADMKQVEENLKKMGPEIAKEMEKAKGEIEKAKAEMKEYKEFVDGLEKDGFINKKENYTIKHKDGELTVNGKKVSEQVYTKYRGFLEKHKKFTIEKNNDDFNIDRD
jgi:myosin heavy subunit